MPYSDPVDTLWFGAHPEDTHRIRPATVEEAATFRVIRLGFTRILTFVRDQDGARATTAVAADDEIDLAMDCELAAWFDADLDAAADLLPSRHRPVTVTLQPGCASRAVT